MEETFLREEEAEAERSCPHKKMRDDRVLRRQKDFDRVYRKGKSVGSRYVVIFTLKNHLPYPRTAFLASKKVGNSVQRNRARRLMKESMRLTEIQLPEGYDYCTKHLGYAIGFLRKARKTDDPPTEKLIMWY